MPDLTGFDLTSSNIKLRDETYLIFKSGSTYYSKKSDGSTNSNSSFQVILQAIIDSIGTRDDTVFTKIKIAPGTYDLNSRVNIIDKYNINIEGSGIGITRIQAGPTLVDNIFDVHGSVSGVGKNLTANGTVRSATVTMSGPDAATFAAGDYLLLRSSLQFGAGGSASGNQGEIKQVLTSAAGVLTFTALLYDTYNTANTANCIKLNMMKNITFSNFTMQKNASYTDTADWWYFKFVNNLSIHDVQVEDFQGSFGGAMQIKSCINVRVANCNLVLNIATTANNQYGISFHSACQQCTVTNCTATGVWRHPFEAGSGETGTDDEGACRAIVFSNCTAMDTDETCFDTHPECDGVIFQGCSAIGTRADRLFRLRGRRGSILNCYGRGATGEGIGIRDDGYDTLVANTTIAQCGAQGILLNDGLDNIRIMNCNVYDNVGDGLNADAGTDKLSITGCLFRDNDGDNIDLTDCDNAIITNNTITGAGAWGITFSGGNCINNILFGNQFSGNTSGAVNNGAQTGSIESSNIGYLSETTMMMRPDMLKYGGWFGGAATNADGILNGSLSSIAVGTGSNSSNTDSTGSYFTNDTGATINSIAGLRLNARKLTRVNNCYFKATIQTGASVANTRIFAGFVNANTAPVSAADPLNALEGCALWYDSAVNANWRRLHNDNAGASVSDDTSLAVGTSTNYTVEIYAVTDNKFRFVFNNTATDISTDIPASGTIIAWWIYIENTTGASRTIRTYNQITRVDK